MSLLFDPVFGMTAMDAATDDRSWLAALCETETALARACSRAGLIDLPTALEIGAAADALASVDAADFGRQGVSEGNPVAPLVDALRERVRERAGDAAADAVHLGAASQDILDTAAMLVASRGLGVLHGELRDCADRTAAIARAHRDTVMTGRTAMQRAVPTTFGALAAVWGSALDRDVARLAAVRTDLPVQLGGPAGSLAGWHPHGFAVRAAFAEELELREPAGVWHTDRGVITELAAALGATAATLGKIAADVVLLSSSEVGELRGRASGGTSPPPSIAPVAAVTARGAAAQAPGLVATIFAAASPELQGAAGSWHAECLAMTALLRCVGGAASRLRSCLVDLEVDAARMRAHVADAPDVGHASDLVDRYLDARRG